MEHETEVLFGGIFQGQRTVVVNGVTFQIDEDQVQALLNGAARGQEGPLSLMPDGRPCVTWVPTGPVRFSLSLDDLESALKSLRIRNAEMQRVP